MTAAVEAHDVIVVGAGPAGIRAAVEARLAGAEVLVLDEAPRPGGQIYRQLPAEMRPRAQAQPSVRLRHVPVSFP